MTDVDADFLKLFEDVADINIGDEQCQKAKPISERDIVAEEYREKSPFSVIYRDHHDVHSEFILRPQYANLSKYLDGHKNSKAKYTPTFLVKTLTNMGLILSHLQHQQISHDTIIVDVLVRTHADPSNVYLSTTIYLIFDVDKEIDEDLIMETRLLLVNHVFDIRSVNIKEQLSGANYASKKKQETK